MMDGVKEGPGGPAVCFAPAGSRSDEKPRDADPIYEKPFHLAVRANGPVVNAFGRG
jgi:hypothetical protein